MYDLAVLIGRFQPFHKGHEALYRHAKTLAKKVLFVLGSQDAAPSCANPWSVAQRIKFMRSAIPYDWEAVSLCDSDYALDQWTRELTDLVYKHAPEAKHIALVGHEKDSTSFYLQHFPQWAQEFLPIQEGGLSASHLRRHIFEAEYQKLEGLVNPLLISKIRVWLKSKLAKKLITEYTYLKSNNDLYGKSLHVFMHSRNRILLEKETGPFQHGLWKLPGLIVPTSTDTSNFPQVLEDFLQTSLALLPHGKILGPWNFDNPGRDPRGKLPASIWLIDLEEEPKHILSTPSNFRWFELDKRPKWRHLTSLDFCRIIGNIQKNSGAFL